MPSAFVYISSGSLVSASPAGRGCVLEVDSQLLRAFTGPVGGRQLDSAGWSFAEISNGDRDGAAVLVLSSSTPVTLDLADLSGVAAWVGDASFARVTACVLTNLGDSDLVVGDAASTPFDGPLSSGGTITVRPGEQFAFRRDDATGYPTASASHLKIDPGASAGLVGVAVLGLST